MRHGRIQTLAAACGLALSLGTLAATPPAPPTEPENTPSTTPAAELATPEDAGTPSNPAGRNCWDSSTWGEKAGESAGENPGEDGAEATTDGEFAKRCGTAEFLMGAQPTEGEPTYPESFFAGRPDPLALRPMYSDELLKRFDTDKDGSLSGQERTTTEVFLEARRSAHKQSLLDKFDYDTSYTLSAAEKLEARRVLFLEQTETLNVFVERFDADRDGVLNDSEAMTARLKDRETFYEVRFHEGAGATLAYRDGPGLPADKAEAFEAASDTLSARAKSSQGEILETVFVTPADEVTTASAGEGSDDGEQTGGQAKAFAEVSADFDGDVSVEGPPN